MLVLHHASSTRPAGIELQPLPRIDVLALFPEERAALLDALRSLSDAQWSNPTVCDAWTVKDIAQHLIADDLGRLSGGRDRFAAQRFDFTGDDSSTRHLLEFINRQNEAWVEATRRLSPRVIVDMLEWTGNQTQAYFESLDPNKMGLGVSWAGESESPNWFDLAREYTERWHHQAQIREGAGLPMLYESRLFAPVLDTFARALPHTFRDLDAPQGTCVVLRITGDAGGTWSILKNGGRWLLSPNAADSNAEAELDQDTAWRLFTRTISASEARKHARLTGNEALAAQVLQMVSIIA